MNMDIDIASTRAVTNHLPPIVDNITSIKNDISRLRRTIDSRIQGRSNIHARLTNSQRDLDFLENELLSLYRTIMQSLSRYEASEFDARSRAENLPT